MIYKGFIKLKNREVTSQCKKLGKKIRLDNILSAVKYRLDLDSSRFLDEKEVIEL